MLRVVLLSFWRVEDSSKVLLWLLALCISDAICTDIGLRANWVSELNPFIKEVYDWNIVAYYVVKIFLPIVLILIYPYVKTNKSIQLGITCCLLLYVCINVYHIVWICLVLYWL